MSNHTEKPPQAMQWISFSSHCLRYYILLSPTLLSVFSQLAKLENILQESVNNKRKMFSSLERGARRLPSITKRRCMIRNFLTTWMSSLLSVFSLPPHERMSHEKWHHQLNSREREWATGWKVCRTQILDAWKFSSLSTATFRSTWRISHAKRKSRHSLPSSDSLISSIRREREFTKDEECELKIDFNCW